MAKNSRHRFVSSRRGGCDGPVARVAQLFRHFFVIASFRDRRIGYPDFVIQAIRHRVERRASIRFGGNSQTSLK
jgi:hypothetical protein